MLAELEATLRMEESISNVDAVEQRLQRAGLLLTPEGIGRLATDGAVGFFDGIVWLAQAEQGE